MPDSSNQSRLFPPAGSRPLFANKRRASHFRAMRSVNRTSTKMMRRCRRSSKKVGSNDYASKRPVAAKEKTMQIELNYPEPVPAKLEAAKAMLLIVDMENEDLHPTGKRYMGEAAAQIVPAIASLRQR